MGFFFFFFFFWFCVYVCFDVLRVPIFGIIQFWEVDVKLCLWFSNLTLIILNDILSIYLSIYIYIYISKSWNITFIVATLQLSHISVYVIIFFLFNFPIIVFNIYFFNIYTSSTFLPLLPCHLSTTSSAFLPPLPFYLPTTLYINIILPLFLHLHLFLSLLIHILLL